MIDEILTAFRKWSKTKSVGLYAEKTRLLWCEIGRKKSGSKRVFPLLNRKITSEKRLELARELWRKLQRECLYFALGKYFKPKTF